MLARAQLLGNRPQERLTSLAHLLAEPPEDQGSAVEAWVLAASAHDKLRQDADAQAALGP